MKTETRRTNWDKDINFQRFNFDKRSLRKPANKQTYKRSQTDKKRQVWKCMNSYNSFQSFDQ